MRFWFHISTALAVFTVTAVFGSASSVAEETAVLPGWYYQTPRNAKPADVFTAIDVVSETLVYLGGIRIDMSSQIPSIKAVGYRSQDSGTSVQDLSGQLNSGSLLGGKMCTMTDMKAMRNLDPANPRPMVWAACGDFIALSPDGATFDRTFDSPSATGDDKEQITSMHLYDCCNGLVGTASGKLYHFAYMESDYSELEKTVYFEEAGLPNVPPVEHPSADPQVISISFIDGNNGWAASVDHEIEEVDQGQGMPVEQDNYFQVRIFRTTNHGATWDVVGRIDLPDEDPVHQTEFGGKKYPLTVDGGWLPRQLQMVDENVGFLGLVGWDKTKSRSNVAKILKTVDGGATWNDLAVNMQIGTLKSMFTQPIFFSEIGGMYFWKDQEGFIRGHVVGSSYITETSSGQGSPTPFYQFTTLDTFDGGLNWKITPDVGEITQDLQGGGAVPSTPRALAVSFLTPYKGFAAGDKGTVFRFEFKCTMQSECEFGYFCRKGELTCLSCAEVDTTHDAAVEKCAGWTPPPEDLGGPSDLSVDRDASVGEDSSVIYPDGYVPQDLNSFKPDSGGCSSGPDGSPFVAIIIAAAVCAIAAMRRRRHESGL